MNHSIDDPIGALWLIQQTKIQPFSCLPVVSGIAKRRKTERQKGRKQAFAKSSILRTIAQIIRL